MLSEASALEIPSCFRNPCRKNKEGTNIPSWTGNTLKVRSLMNRTETEVRNLRIQEALQEQLKLPLLFYVLTLTARLVFRFPQKSSKEIQMPLKCRKIRSHLTGKIKLRKRLRNLTKNPHSFKFNENSLHAIKIIWPLWLPLRFWLLFQGEGTYKKKLDVITFPLSRNNRGASKLQWSEMPSKQKALVCPKTATKIWY